MIEQKKKHILVADNSIFFRTKLSAILVESGYTIEVVRDGKEAMEAISAKPRSFDMMTLDLGMPEMDGFTLLAWLKTSKYAGFFPVVVITGIFSLSTVKESLEALGAVEILSKLYTPEQVRFTINGMLFPDAELKRGDRRVPISLNVLYSKGKTEVSGFLINISVSGIFLHTPVPLAKGEEITAYFSLHSSKEVVKVKGVVMWSTPPEAAGKLFGGSGIRFTEVSDEDKAAIKRYVEVDAINVPGL